VIVETSAIVAMIYKEPIAEACVDAILRADVVRLSTASLLEAAIVIDSNRDPILSRRLDEALHEFGIALESVTSEQARIAREAYRDFGRGSGHPAQLNFGDCFAYALAKATGEPLLFVGNDFSHTDVESAL
jgi:ribonuclease VapC